MLRLDRKEQQKTESLQGTNSDNEEHEERRSPAGGTRS